MSLPWFNHNGYDQTMMNLNRVLWLFGILGFQEAEGRAPEAAYQPEVLMVLIQKKGVSVATAE